MNTAHNFSRHVKPILGDCQIHGESLVSVYGRPMCKSCAAALISKTHTEHNLALSADLSRKHLAGAKLPTRYNHSGFKNYLAHNEGQREAKNQCVGFARDFKNNLKRNLVMLGRTGTGKTHLACAVVRNVLNDSKYARYVTSEDMVNEIAQAWSNPSDTEQQAVHRFSEYDLLVLDEYGLHDRHENRLQLAHKVLYARYDLGKPTMLISNMGLDELKLDLGDRLWSRLQHDGLTLVECNWADQRLGAGA